MGCPIIAPSLLRELCMNKKLILKLSGCLLLKLMAQEEDLKKNLSKCLKKMKLLDEDCKMVHHQKKRKRKTAVVKEALMVLSYKQPTQRLKMKLILLSVIS